jgi:hypothetical protein
MKAADNAPSRDKEMKRPFALAPAWLVCSATLALSWAAGLLSLFPVVPPHELVPVTLALGLVVLVVQIAWYLSAYSLAQRGAWQSNTGVSALFLGHAILAVLGIMVGLTTSIEIGMVAVFAAVVLYYTALVLVAHAIVKAEQRSLQFDSIMGTSLLLAVLPLGVWFLRPRVEKLASATS